MNSKTTMNGEMNSRSTANGGPKGEERDRERLSSREKRDIVSESSREKREKGEVVGEGSREKGEPNWQPPLSLSSREKEGAATVVGGRRSEETGRKP